MTSATIVRLSDHARPARRIFGPTAVQVLPFVSRRATLSAEAVDARNALAPLRSAADAALEKVSAAMARGAPEGELRALRRLASKARCAAAVAAARAVCTAMEASAA